jgi:hypothetical protein
VDADRRDDTRGRCGIARHRQECVTSPWPCLGGTYSPPPRQCPSPARPGNDRVHDGQRNVVRMAPRLHLPTVMTSQAHPEPWQRAEARHTVASGLRTNRDAGLAAA